MIKTGFYNCHRKFRTFVFARRSADSELGFEIGLY